MSDIYLTHDLGRMIDDGCPHGDIDHDEGDVCDLAMAAGMNDAR